MAETPMFLRRYCHGWRGDFLALLAGAVMPLSFAPLNWWPVALFSMALLFSLWLFSDVRRATWRGFFFGLGMFGVGINWIFISIYYHGFVPLFLSLLLTAALVVVMSVFPALLGNVITRCFPTRFGRGYTQLKLLLAMPAAWMLIEWFRGWFFTGFPWLSLGYSQVDGPLAGWAPLVGVFGVSWLVALSAALLLALSIDTRGRYFYAAGLALIWVIALPMKATYWTESNNAPLKVALLQGNIPQDLKWHPDVRQPTVDLYTELTRSHWDADLIVWPETAIPAFRYEVEEFLDSLESEAQENNTDLLVGLLTLGDDNVSYYNTILSLGSSREQYHKDHLVPFTEYLPLKSVLGSLVQFMQVPMSDFSAGGSHQKPLNVAGQRAGISICFEDAFGEEIINALPEATFLVNVSNDAWFDDSWAPPQHLQMARMRALETERPLLRATNTGMTAIVDAKGNVMAQAPQFQIAAISETIQPRSGNTLYAMTGNWLMVILGGLLIGFAFWRTKVKSVPSVD